MAKFKVGQEVFFANYVGNKIRPISKNGGVILCDVIKSKYVHRGVTYYTFEHLCFRLPENKLFTTQKEIKNYLKGGSYD